MDHAIEKVTAFITRKTEVGIQLLLFQHPYAGNQIPAGTVEEHETPEQAALREAEEETGLQDFSMPRFLGCHEDRLPEGEWIILQQTNVFSRPDNTSFDWAFLRKGITVSALRTNSGYTQITYVEHDQVPEPQYVSMQITGWVPNDALNNYRRRHFFHLEFQGESPESWETFSDHHRFYPYWAQISNLPEIIAPQDDWLKYLA